MGLRDDVLANKHPQSVVEYLVDEKDMQTMWKRSGHCHGGSDLVLKRAVQSGFALLWLPRTRHSYATYALNLIGVGRGKHMESSTPMFMPGKKKSCIAVIGYGACY